MANLTTIEVLRIPGTLFPRGPYDENASYKFLNFVESGGNGYVCLQPCTGIPVTNTAYWFKFVFRGEKGAAFTYADLTAEQKAELVRDATAAAQAAASSAQSAADDAAAALQKFNAIKAAIDALDPTSTEGSIQTIAAKQGLLESELDALGQKIDGYVPQTLTIEQGAVASADGTDSTANNRVRTNGYITCNTLKIEITSGKYYVFGYDDEGYVGIVTNGWKSASDVITKSGCTKYRVVFAKSNDGNIAPSGFADLGVKVWAYDDDEKKVVLKSDLPNVLGGNNVSIDLTGIERHTNYIIADTGKWAASAHAQIIFVPLSGVSTVKVTTTTYELIYAFLTSNSVGSTGDTAAIVSGESRKTVAVNTTANIEVPEGASYLYMHVKNTDGTDKLSSYSLAVITGVYAEIHKVYNVANQSLTKVNSLAGLVDITQFIGKVVKGLSFRHNMQRVISTVYDGYFAIDISSFSRIKIKTPISTSTTSITRATGYILHNDYDPALAINTSDFGDFTKNSIVAYAIFTYGAEENGSEFREFDTNGAKYLSLPYWNDANAESYGRFEAYGYVDASNVVSLVESNLAKTNKLEKKIDEGAFGDSVRDVPKDITVLNAYKKAKQMLNVKWSCVANGIASKNGASTYSQGNYTGVPYSSVKEIYTFVPRDVSFHTFVTAAHNPYSLLYTENVSNGNSASDIGKTYHGTNCGTYMGAVCSVLTSYALGTRIKYDTADMRALPDLFEPIYNQSAQGVQLMNVLVNNSHTILVTDIYRNRRGLVTSIKTIEEVGNMQEHIWTESSFNDMLAANNYVIYRYKDLYKNIEYVQSDVVAVTEEGEEESHFTFNEDICTFKGDRCTFKEGDTIRINFFDGNYTAMEIYKDDILIDTITTLDTSTHYVDLTSSNLTFGKYKARMVKSDSSYSEYTTFEIIDYSVGYDSSTHTVTWTSHNAVARQAMYVTRDGTRLQYLDLLDEDEGSAEMAPTYTTSSMVYLIVEFLGDYGGTISEFISI